MLPPIRARLAVAALLILLAACSPAPTPAPPSSSNQPSPAASSTASAVPSCAAQTLQGMNEGQRVGQLFLLGLANDQLGVAEQNAIVIDHVGAVWFTATSQAGAATIRSIADSVQVLAPAAGVGGGKVGLFVAANQEGGLVQALRGPGFSRIPTAVDQGRLSVTTLQADAKTWGNQLRAAGINLDFAPVSDVVPTANAANNEPIGVLQREYGATATVAGSHAAAFVEGMTSAGILTVAKHFPGLGRVTGNTDNVAGVVDSKTTPTDPNLGSFRTVIGARVSIVMVALATYTRIDPSTLAAFSPIVIGTLLRKNLGFGGLVMSDDLGATAAVAGIPPATRAIDFISAGGEMIISKTVDPTIAMALAITSRASTDPAFRTLVDNAALHVLEVKAQAHLLTCGGS